MSMVGELKYFLGLQVAQGEDGTRIHQQKYVKEILKKFQADPRETHVKAVKRILRYLKGTDDLCLFYPRGGDLVWQPTPMQIMRVARQTGSPRQGWLSILGHVSSHGLQRSSPPLHFPSLRWNTSTLLLAVRSCYGLGNS
ncbi:unnamed protein product [Rhodiola kirilowii]